MKGGLHVKLSVDPPNRSARRVMARPAKSLGSLVRRALNRTDLVAGRYITGNPRGISQNLKGNATILSSRLSGNYRRSGPICEEARVLRRLGYVALGQPYDAALLEELQTRFARFIKSDTASQPTGYETEVGYARGVIDPARNFPELAELLSPRIIELVSDTFRTHIGVARVQAWRNIHLPPDIADTEYIYSQWWHCDNRRTSLIKLFVTLSDTGDDDGPFHILSKARTRWLVRHGYRSRTTGRQDSYGPVDGVIEDPSYVVRMTGSAGTAMLANTAACLHRAGVPAPGHHRDIACFYLVPGQRPLPTDWIANVGNAENV